MIFSIEDANLHIDKAVDLQLWTSRNAKSSDELTKKLCKIYSEVATKYMEAGLLIKTRIKEQERKEDKHV